ncbi:hypothetical protein BD769DRAFT_1673597 [Suillus cothurnatus]|nr:hypothetical protein BD769DRAFT_1673597 [Suillus cothurnatus]
MGQGGRLTQLQKLESSQIKRQHPMKKNLTQEMIASQPVNFMAPEAPKRKPRAKPIKATQTSSNEKTEQHLSSSNLPQCDAEDKPISHPRSPNSRFGFVPPPSVTSKCHFIGALSRFNGTPSGSSQPNTPKYTHTGAHLQKHDNLHSYSKSDTSHALPASKPVPLEHTSTVINHQCPNSSIDTPSPVTAICPLTWTLITLDHHRWIFQMLRLLYLAMRAKTQDGIMMWMLMVNHGNDGDSGDVDQDVDVGVDQDDGDSSHNARDVLQDHRAKNCRPHMPNPDELETLSRSSSEEEVVVPCKRMRMIKATAQNVCFYPPSWKDVLEAAKKKSRLGLLTKTLEDFGSQGVGVADGYWDEYKSDMAVLLWDNRATMHSEMKKVACPIFLAHYKILPPDVDDKNDHEQEVHDNTKALLQDGAFPWDRGRTNNLANEALSSFCMSYFYKGENALAKTFPDLFTDAVPEGAITLAATALAAAIDEYKTDSPPELGLNEIFDVWEMLPLNSMDLAKFGTLG